MTFSSSYSTEQPSRAEIDARREPTLLEFGTNWCGYCQGAQSFIREALAPHQSLNHIKAEDGPGRPLGRSFRVKLWPTLIAIKNGEEVGRVVRPQSVGEIEELLGKL